MSIDRRRLIFVFGALGLVTTMADTVRLFLCSPDYSIWAVVMWGFLAVWLLVPLGTTVHQLRRARLESALSVDVRGELLAAAVSPLIFGYGTAAFALRVVASCLRR